MNLPRPARGPEVGSASPVSSTAQTGASPSRPRNTASSAPAASNASRGSIPGSVSPPSASSTRGWPFQKASARPSGAVRNRARVSGWMRSSLFRSRGLPA